MEELGAVAAKYPSSRSYLEPSIRQLNAEIAHIDSGNVKSQGEWISKQSYIKRLATKLAGLLKAEIARARPPSSLKLEDDPRFIGLKELADTNADAKRLATEISAHLEGAGPR